MIVVDASVLGPALADDGPDGDLARARCRDESLVAPELIDLEIVSMLRRANAAGAVDDRRSALALIDLEVLPLERVAHAPLLPRVWELRSNVTPYDAAYVALAELLDLVFVTSDQRLAHAPGARCTFELLTS